MVNEKIIGDKKTDKKKPEIKPKKQILKIHGVGG